MQHQHRLLLGILYRHEPHRRARNGLADCFRISGIVLVALDVGLHVGRRHQLHRMPQRRQLTRPMVRCRAGFHADQTRRERPEVGGHAAARQPPANDNVPIGVDAVDLEPVFGEIQTDGGNLHGGRLLSFVAFTDDHVVAHRCRERGPSTPSRVVTNRIPVRTAYRFGSFLFGSAAGAGLGSSSLAFLNSAIASSRLPSWVRTLPRPMWGAGFVGSSSLAFWNSAIASSRLPSWVRTLPRPRWGAASLGSSSLAFWNSAIASSCRPSWARTSPRPRWGVASLGSSSLAFLYSAIASSRRPSWVRTLPRPMWGAGFVGSSPLAFLYSAIASSWRPSLIRMLPSP